MLPPDDDVVVVISLAAGILVGTSALTLARVNFGDPDDDDDDDDDSSEHGSSDEPGRRSRPANFCIYLLHVHVFACNKPRK